MLRRTFLTGVATVAASPAWAASKAAGLREAVEPIRVAANVPAVGLGVVDRGKVVFLGGLGEVGGRAATEHDRFRAASISKLFTAQAIMRLADEKKLTLDDDVGRWLPDFGGRGLTIRLLLAHRSGLRDAIFPVDRDDPARVPAYLKLLAAQPAARAPGAAYAYTDADYNVLGGIIEAASGVAYEAYVRTALIDRLKLPDADIFPLPGARTSLAPPFLNQPVVRPATPRPFDVAFAPSEGLVTGARDLTLWTQATLRRDRRLLRRASFDAMLQPLGDGGGPGRFAGIGWQLRSEDGRDIAEHGGSVRGYNALVLTYPKERRGFVILTNADDAPRWEMARALDRALDAPAPLG